MTATNFFQNQQSIHEIEDVPCVEFSAMGFASYESQQSFSTASTTSSAELGKRSSNLSGWGSTISRKSYACLKTLGDNEARKIQRPTNQFPRQSAATETADNWGYFVDTTDN